MGRGKTASRLLFEESKAFFAKYPNDMTRQAYIKNYRKYIYFCREQYACKTKGDCAAHIADYAAHLQKQGYTASTIHTYLAPVAIYHGINLAELDKPKRKTAAYTRGRSLSGKTPRSDNNFLNKQYARTVAFQRRVGIRRAELARLDCCFSFQGKFFHFFTINRHREVEHNLPYPASIFSLFR